MTLLASSENVLATMPPQPRSYDRAITLPLVPGGPDPSRNGLSNFMPLTVMLRSVTSPPSGNGWAITGREGGSTGKCSPGQWYPSAMRLATALWLCTLGCGFHGTNAG